MIKLNDLQIDVRGFGKEFLLTAIKEDKKYEGGQRTDQRIGTKYEVAIPELRLEKINVKISGKQTFQESILTDNKMTKVAFDNLVAHFYSIDGRIGITATASAIKVVD